MDTIIEASIHSQIEACGEDESIEKKAIHTQRCSTELSSTIIIFLNLHFHVLSYHYFVFLFYNLNLTPSILFITN
jgi:hypothetical protein